MVVAETAEKNVAIVDIFSRLDALCSCADRIDGIPLSMRPDNQSMCAEQTSQATELYPSW